MTDAVLWKTGSRANRRLFRSGSDSEQSVTESIKVKVDLTVVGLIGQVDSAKLDPQQMVEFGLEQPSDACRDEVKRAILHLYRSSGMKPNTVLADVEGGILVTYRSSRGTLLELAIEDDQSVHAIITNPEGMQEHFPVKHPKDMNWVEDRFRAVDAIRP